ncbi:MAG: O-antigen ligase family protein [Candidatus Paceibacterota bacterium]
MIKNILQQWVRFYAYAVFFMIPFGTKKLLMVGRPEFFEYAREFSSFFLYATDITLLLFILISLFYFKKTLFKNEKFDWVVAGIALCAGASLFLVHDIVFSLYAFFRLCFVILFALGIRTCVREGIISFQGFCAVIGVSAVFQSILAIAQFLLQQSAGVWFLGESVIRSTTPGVARVAIGGVNYLRAYGTMPHANILAAFFMMGLFALIVLFFITPKEEQFLRVIVPIEIFLVLIGLILTFSRSGWIVAAFLIVSSLCYGLLHRAWREVATELLVMLCVFAIALSLIFGWAIIPRVGFAKGEPSVDHRMFYNEMGIQLIKERPLGVGISNQVLFSAENGLYLEKGLDKVWTWQPIHNLFILITVELGIQGLILFVLLFALVGTPNKWTPHYISVALLLCAFLLFGLFDHFFWDLEAGRLMFWVVLGIMVGLETKQRAEEPL